MAVRINIGDITNAIEKGIKAESKVDYGPVRDPKTTPFFRPTVADFQNNSSYPNAFIMGIHRWCDLNNKVTS